MYTEPSTEKLEIVHTPPPPKPRRGPAARPPAEKEIKAEENIREEISMDAAAENAEEVLPAAHPQPESEPGKTEAPKGKSVPAEMPKTVGTEEEVKKYIYDELDAAIPMLDDAPAASGYIAKGTALAIKMRSALYYADYQRAKEAAKAIMDLGQYELDPS